MIFIASKTRAIHDVCVSESIQARQIEGLRMTVWNKLHDIGVYGDKLHTSENFFSVLEA